MATPSGDAATSHSSASAPDILGQRTFSSSPIASSPSYNASPSTSSPGSKPEPSPSSSALGMGETNASLVDVEPDAQIVEALKNKDRLYVLKLGEQMEALIKERDVQGFYGEE